MDWQEAAEDVRVEYLWAWRHYVDRAFGHDQIRPVSGRYEEFFSYRHPVGLSLVEALDTLWLMELDDEVARAVTWIKQNLSFDIDAWFDVFEANIRLVGGLLAGHHVTGEQRLLELAVDLADRLLPAFTLSPTGLPYGYVNLATGAVRRTKGSLASVGTYIAEFGTLSAWTGDRRYYDAAKTALHVAYETRSGLDLVPVELNVETGRPRSRVSIVDPPADSFYEALWDGYALFGDSDLKRWYDTLTAAIVRHQAETVDGRLWFGHADVVTGEITVRKQSELTCFYAGLLAEAGDLERGRAYLDSWHAVQERYGVLPEVVDYTTLAPTIKGNELRPEFPDAALQLWLLTGDDVFRERAHAHYRSMKATSKTNYGYTVLADVTKGAKGDRCPGWWWSEQPKYYWLMFSETDRFNMSDNYLSTEGNLLRGAKR
jgi:mannosyl-oligosaccharide alpha-1,2-mannosidase